VAFEIMRRKLEAPSTSPPSQPCANITPELSPPTAAPALPEVTKDIEAGLQSSTRKAVPR